MEFTSLESLFAYIEKSVAATMTEVGSEMMDIMKDETHKQVYSAYKPKKYVRSYDLMRSIGVVEKTPISVTTEWQPNGDWFSVINGNRFYAIRGLEAGTTWGRGGTNLMEETTKRIEDEIPNVFRQAMNGKGVPIK